MGVTEDEMVQYHHWLKGHESEQTLGNSGGQTCLWYCGPWGREESDVTKVLNNHNMIDSTVLISVVQ